MILSPVTSIDKDPVPRKDAKRSGKTAREGQDLKPLITEVADKDTRTIRFTSLEEKPAADTASSVTQEKVSFAWPSYAFWPMGLTLVLFLVGAYVSNLTFPLIATLGGLLCFGFWRYAAAFRMPLISLTLLIVWGALDTDSRILIAAFSSFKAFGDTQWAKTAAQLIFLPPLVLAAWRMPGRDAHRLMSVVKWGMAALAVIMLYESFSGAGLYQWLSLHTYQPIRPDLAVAKASLTTYQLVWVIWPLALMAAAGGNKPVIWLITASVIVAPIMMGANAVTLGLAGSVIVFLAAKYWPKVWDGIEHVMAMMFAGMILLFPGIMSILSGLGVVEHFRTHLPASWAARVTIWEAAATKMFEWPLTGFGFDYSRHFKAIPLHPHNAAIQTGLELGYVGLIIVALFWVQTILRIGKPERLASETALEPEGEAAEVETPQMSDLSLFMAPTRIDPKPYMLAAIVPYLVFVFMSFGMWQEWFVAMGAIIVTVCLLACRSVEYESSMWSASPKFE